jgi:hypothetical protein
MARVLTFPPPCSTFLETATAQDTAACRICSTTNCLDSEAGKDRKSTYEQSHSLPAHQAGARGGWVLCRNDDHGHVCLKTAIYIGIWGCPGRC